MRNKQDYSHSCRQVIIKKKGHTILNQQRKQIPNEVVEERKKEKEPGMCRKKGRKKLMCPEKG